MKKRILYGGLVIACMAGLFAFNNPQSAVTGSIVPGDGAVAVWAYNGTDSTRGVILNTGTFTITVKPGIYKVVVDAKSPYKDVLLENIDVKEDRPMDIGQIILQK